MLKCFIVICQQISKVCLLSVNLLSPQAIKLLVNLRTSVVSKFATRCPAHLPPKWHWNRIIYTVAVLDKNKWGSVWWIALRHRAFWATNRDFLSWKNKHLFPVTKVSRMTISLSIIKRSSIIKSQCLVVASTAVET